MAAAAVAVAEEGTARLHRTDRLGGTRMAEKEEQLRVRMRRAHPHCRLLAVSVRTRPGIAWPYVRRLELSRICHNSLQSQARKWRMKVGDLIRGGPLGLT